MNLFGRILKRMLVCTHGKELKNPIKDMHKKNKFIYVIKICAPLKQNSRSSSPSDVVNKINRPQKWAVFFY